MDKIRGEALGGPAISSSLWAPLVLGAHWIRGAANTSKMNGKELIIQMAQHLPPCDNPGFCRNTGGVHGVSNKVYFGETIFWVE